MLELNRAACQEFSDVECVTLVGKTIPELIRDRLLALEVAEAMWKIS